MENDPATGEHPLQEEEFRALEQIVRLELLPSLSAAIRALIREGAKVRGLWPPEPWPSEQLSGSDPQI